MRFGIATVRTEQGLGKWMWDPTARQYHSELELGPSLLPYSKEFLEGNIPHKRSKRRKYQNKRSKEVNET
jgi:hypothetical protein